MAFDGDFGAGSDAAAALQRYGRAGLEAQYNLRGHPARAAAYADYAQRSAALRQERGALVDLQYGPGGNERLDLFRAAAPDAPLLVFIHGGYWRALDKATFSFLAEPYLDAGMAVALLEYDLAPRVTVATIVGQVRRALAWLARAGGEYGYDGGRIVVSGHSAGGHLTAMALATAWTEYGLERAPLVAGVPVSGLFDLRPLVHTSVNDDIRIDAAEAVRLSPGRMAAAMGRPLLLVVGGDETEGFRRQTIGFGSLVREAGGRAEVLVRDGFNHFTILADCADPAGPVATGIRRLAGLG